MTLLDSRSGELDRLFDCMRHPARRRIVALLVEDAPRSVAELARDGLDSDVDGFDRLASELYHAHLPKLDEAGFVRWDRDTATVERGPRFEELVPVVRLLADHRDDHPGEWS